MKQEIRFAQPNELVQIHELDRHLGEKALAQKIGAGEILVAEVSGILVGLLRYGMFWDEMPFMNMLRVRDAYQLRGIGRALVRTWEDEMLKLGHTSVLTSTQADEEAQHFYRKLGYTDIGGFVLPGEPLEIVLFKEIG